MTGVLREEHDAQGGLSLKVPTMADHFRRQGWKTALIGKWHLRPTPRRRGNDTVSVQPRTLDGRVAAAAVDHHHLGAERAQIAVAGSSVELEVVTETPSAPSRAASASSWCAAWSRAS